MIDSRRIFALDIGGTYTKYGMYEDGRFVKKGKWRTEYDESELIKIILSYTDQFKPHCIAVSSGGFWDCEGRSQGFATIPATADGKFVRDIRQLTGCEVKIENDARCAAICHIKRSEKLTDDFVYFAAGSSLGCAVVSGGIVLRGYGNQAGCMFAMPEVCDPNRYVYDCFANTLKSSEEYSSSAKGNFKLVVQNALSGDEKAQKTVDCYCKSVALKAFYATLAYDPQKIIFGGGVMSGKELFSRIKDEFNFLAREVKEKTLPEIVLSEFGEEVNLLGAVCLFEE